MKNMLNIVESSLPIFFRQVALDLCRKILVLVLIVLIFVEISKVHSERYPPTIRWVEDILHHQKDG